MTDSSAPKTTKKSARAKKPSAKALEDALLDENLELVRELLEAGANPNAAADKHSSLPLRTAMRAKEPAEFVSLLLAHGADPKPPQARPVLMDRNAYCGSAAWQAAMKKLFDAGLDVNMRDESGMLLLPTTVLSHTDEEVLQLIAQGADPNLHDMAASPLQIAVHRGHLDKVEALLKAGANPNAVGEDGDTPIIVGARRAGPRTMELLLRAGADPNAVAADGQSAWSIAMIRAPNLAQLLEAHGARPKELLALDRIVALAAEPLGFGRGRERHYPGCAGDAFVRGRLDVAEQLLEEAADREAELQRSFTASASNVDAISWVIEHGGVPGAEVMESAIRYWHGRALETYLTRTTPAPNTLMRGMACALQVNRYWAVWLLLKHGAPRPDPAAVTDERIVSLLRGEPVDEEDARLRDVQQYSNTGFLFPKPPPKVSREEIAAACEEVAGGALGETGGDTSCHGRSVLDIVAYEASLDELAIAIVRKGVVSQPTLDRALTYAVRGSPELTSVLLNAGANPSAKLEYQTPLGAACSFGDPTIVTLLLDAGADPLGTPKGNSVTPMLEIDRSGSGAKQKIRQLLRLARSRLYPRLRSKGLHFRQRGSLKEVASLVGVERFAKLHDRGGDPKWSFLAMRLPIAGAMAHLLEEKYVTDVIPDVASRSVEPDRHATFAFQLHGHEWTIIPFAPLSWALRVAPKLSLTSRADVIVGAAHEVADVVHCVNGAQVGGVSESEERGFADEVEYSDTEDRRRRKQFKDKVAALAREQKLFVPACAPDSDGYVDFLVVWGLKREDFVRLDRVRFGEETW